MKVETIMKTDVKVWKEDDSLNYAAHLMWENDCGCIPVIECDGTGKVIAIITDHDICMAAYTQGKPLSEAPVKSAMSSKVLSCKTGDELASAEAVMREGRVRRLPVLDADGALRGIISLNDIARASVAGSDNVARGELARTLASICEPRIVESTQLSKASRAAS